MTTKSLWSADVNISTWLLSLCPNNNKVHPVSWWSILIFWWWKFLHHVFACWALVCPFVYCHFALFLLGDLFLCVLEAVLFLALCPFFLLPNYSNVYVELAMQSGLGVHLSLFPGYLVSSLHHLFCSFYPFGHLTHAPLLFHACTVLCLWLYYNSWSCR